MQQLRQIQTDLVARGGNAYAYPQGKVSRAGMGQGGDAGHDADGGAGREIGVSWLIIAPIVIINRMEGGGCGAGSVSPAILSPVVGGGSGIGVVFEENEGGGGDDEE